MVIGFCGALRGEEIPKSDLEHLTKRLAEGLAHSSSPHVPVALLGRFKRQVGVKLFFLPLAPISASGIETGLWIQRLISSYQELGIASGPLIRVRTKSGTRGYRRAKVRDLDPLFHDVLKRVQNKSPHIISPDLNVAEEFSMSRSLRRGATTHARVQSIPEEMISANNRWRREEASRGLCVTQG